MKRALSIALLLSLQAPVFAAQYQLDDGTPLKLRVNQTVNTDTAREGDTASFRLEDNVVSKDGQVLLKAGTLANGTVTKLAERGRVGMAGNIEIRLDDIKAIDGTRIPLRATLSKKGSDKMVLSVVLSVLLAPIGLLFLLMRVETLLCQLDKH